MLVDLLHLSRNLGRSPASAGAAVLTLTLGVGASIFSVVDAVLLTPPPFADPDALITLGEIQPGESVLAPRSVRYSTVEAWRERAGSLAAIEASNGTHLVLTEPGSAERLHVTEVTPGFLPLLGVALLAIVLSGIGLFGVVAHDVASRRAELALRLALGADPMRILIRTLEQGTSMVGAGLVMGGILSIWATRSLGSFLFATGSFRSPQPRGGGSGADGCWCGRRPSCGATRVTHRSPDCPSERIGPGDGCDAFRFQFLKLSSRK